VLLMLLLLLCPPSSLSLLRLTPHSRTHYSVHKLLWTPATSTMPSGMLVGGMDAGHITLFNAGAMLG
jgi:hypothetical protein